MKGRRPVFVSEKHNLELGKSKLRLSSPRFLRTVLAALAVLSFLNLTALSQAFAASESLLWNFGNGDDGNTPVAGLAMDKSGNLFGTTQDGGIYGEGTMFELTPQSAGGWTESVLFSFGGTDGSSPEAGLLIANGNLYGTTGGGGTYGYGTVFELEPQTGGGWAESVLFSFNGTDGNGAFSGLTMDSSGNLYGTTYSGSTGLGTVFELTPPPSGGTPWTESILWNFPTEAGGFYVAASLIMDTRGNLYGTASAGGTCFSDGFPSACQPSQTLDFGGTVFELTPPVSSGEPWTESTLWNFGNGGDGQMPDAGLIADSSGNLYGTTKLGGRYGGFASGGTVFKLTPPSRSGGKWTESVLWSFGNGTDGAEPRAGLIMDSSGNLYGTTAQGGADTDGTVFELTPPSKSGGSWTESILLSFNGTDGSDPGAGLIMDNNGNLYSTTETGGAYGAGTVFKVAVTGTGTPTPTRTPTPTPTSTPRPRR
jgi:uncharacterized repeat protein (TIGR03803 family)